MKKRDLKNRITEAFKAESPDLSARILASCSKEPQLPASAFEMQLDESPMKRLNYNVIFKRVVACAICLVLFISGLSIGLLIPNGDNNIVRSDVETFVYLDVNPSIELRMDDENNVVECLAGNGDAEAILLGLKLEGVDMNTALTAIVGAMYVNGYLVENSNSILISVDAKDDETTESLLADITNKINTVFEKNSLECSIIAQSVDVDDELEQRALKSGVSVGKMHLVDKMVGKMDEFNSEDASELVDMSIKELNLIYSTRPHKGEEDDPFGKDVSSGDVSGFVNQKDALTLLLTAIEVNQNCIEWYRVQAKPQHQNGNRQMVYKVSIRLKDDTATYEFEVDCQTGEVVKIDTDMPNINFSDGHGGASQIETTPNSPEQNAPSHDKKQDERQDDTEGSLGDSSQENQNDIALGDNLGKEDSNDYSKTEKSD